MNREEHAKLSEYNQTSMKLQYVNPCQRLRENAKRFPDKTAAIFGNSRLTYAQLDYQSDVLAERLMENHSKKRVVGVCMNRSLQLVIALYGIWKSGNVYLPIDPAYPFNRIAYIIKDSQVKTLIVNSANTNYNHFSFPNKTIIDLKDISLVRGSISKKNKSYDSICQPNDSAYLIYTSGSTGKPKGVVNTFKGLYNRINWMRKKLNYDEETVFFQKTPYSFDVSMWELTLPFYLGGRLIIAKPDGHKDISYLINMIKRYGVTTIHFVPSVLSIFLNNKNLAGCSSLKSIVCSGEALPKTTAKHLLEKLPHVRLYNLYGPTEAAIDVTSYQVTKQTLENNLDSNIVPIGFPIDNTKIYIIGNNGKELPFGTKGELCISGIGVAKGYFGKDSLTQDKFIKNNFYHGSNQIYRRLYHSGDFAVKQRDGLIMFAGRKDNQVKLNGQRVELGEIETIISHFASIQMVSVLVKEVSNTSSLCVYYVSSEPIDIDWLKKQLKNQLPNYMVPQYYIRLAKAPLTPNGKLDVKYLKGLPIDVNRNNKVVNPKNTSEAKLLKVFKDVLNNDHMGVTDNFFDFGGDSLSAVEAISDDDDVTLDQLYKYQTVRGILQAKQYMAKMSGEELKRLKISDKSDTARNIIAVPYGGGNPFAYEPFKQYLPHNTNLFVIDLPGHHHNDGADSLCSVMALVKKVFQIVQQRNLKNIYIYGHCTGTSVAYALARLLSFNNLPVKKLVLGASYPILLEEDKDKSGMPNFNDHNSIYKYIRSLGGLRKGVNEKSLDEILNWFQFDVKNAQSYFANTFQKDIEHPLKAPMVVITGDSDPFTEKAKSSVNQWSRLGINVSYKSISNANHYFISKHSKEIIKYILDK